MKQLKYSWLNEDFSRLTFLRARLPHALLVSGAEGIGKRELATHFAQSLLCQDTGSTGHPCGICQACRWFEAGNHPDFRCLLPETLQEEAAASLGSENAESAGEPGKSVRGKAPSREIKIEQVRELDGFFNVGTHRGGGRVVLVYPADALNIPASNALLKVLEEPAAGTIFLLVTSHADRLLATIRSRAGKFTVAQPERESCIAWLESQGVARAAERLAEVGGAPLAVLNDPGSDDFAAEREELLNALSAARFDPLVTAERCEKAGNERLAVWMLRWVVDLTRVIQPNVLPRFHPDRLRALQTTAARAGAARLHHFYRALVAARRVSGHPLNSRLFAERLLISYQRVLHLAAA